MNDEKNLSTHKGTPSFQDKEERRLITLASLDNLLKFHEIEKQERASTLKLYTFFVGGGIATLTGIEKILPNIEGAVIKYIAICVITTFNLLVIKKMIALRGASNNIYNEYGRRLKYLIDSHVGDLNEEGIRKVKNVFLRYIGEQKIEILPKNGADTFEIYGFSLITCFMSFLYFFPISEVVKVALNLNNVRNLPNSALLIIFIIFLIHFIIILRIIFNIINQAGKMPNQDFIKPIK